MRAKYSGAVLVLMATAAPAPAHHAFAAEFDPDKPIHLEGPVTKMEDRKSVV